MTDQQAREEKVEAGQPSRRGLNLLLASTAVAVSGQGMVIAAGPLLAASLSRHPLAVSAVAAASPAAWLVMGLPAGALVDRLSRRRVMIVTDALRAALLLFCVPRSCSMSPPSPC